MRDEPFVPALGALSGGQAVQSVKAGLKAIYCSGWQVAADANTAGQVYPDQSLYPADAVPTLVKRLNRALTRADQIEHAEGGESSEGRRGEGFCGFLLPSARSGQRSRGSCLLFFSSERSGQRSRRSFLSSFRQEVPLSLTTEKNGFKTSKPQKTRLETQERPATGTPRSSPTPRPASAGRSTASR